MNGTYKASDRARLYRRLLRKARRELTSAMGDDGYWAVWNDYAVWGIGRSEEEAIRDAEAGAEEQLELVDPSVRQDDEMAVTPCSAALYHDVEARGGDTPFSEVMADNGRMIVLREEAREFGSQTREASTRTAAPLDQSISNVAKAVEKLYRYVEQQRNVRGPVTDLLDFEVAGRNLQNAHDELMLAYDAVVPRTAGVNTARSAAPSRGPGQRFDPFPDEDYEDCPDCDDGFVEVMPGDEDLCPTCGGWGRAERRPAPRKTRRGPWR